MYHIYMKIISEGYNRLANLPVENAELGSIVLNGLRAIQDSPDLMDSILHGISPFTEHFFHELATLPQSDGSHWLSLLEDMAVLFREHKLNREEETLVKEEYRLLEFFESSEMWKAGDGTLISFWYWEELPRRFPEGNKIHPADTI